VVRDLAAALGPKGMSRRCAGPGRAFGWIVLSAGKLE